MSFRIVFASLMAVTALGATTAGAQQPVPEPGCAGLAITDAPDDAKRFGTLDAPDNFDVTGVFFVHRDGKTYAVMQTQGPGGSKLPTGATGARWYIFFKKGDQELFVRAGNITPDGESFEYGHTDTSSATGQYVKDADTTGRFGDGFLEIVVPGAQAKSGQTISAPRAETFERVGNRLFDIDKTEGTGKAYTVGACESASAGPDPTVPAPPAPGDPVDPGVPSDPTAPGSQPAGTLQVSAPATAKLKGRRLTLTLTSVGKVTNLRAALKKGSKTVGKGTLASIEGKRALKLTLGNKVKKGSYTLVLTGINADGGTATRKLSLRLK